MSDRSTVHAERAPNAHEFSPARAGILQRKCACGQHAIGGECESCKKNKVQRRFAGGGRGGAHTTEASARSSSLNQPGLEVGRADDPLEIQADEVARRVMEMPDTNQANSISRGGDLLRRTCQSCKTDDDDRTHQKIARKSVSAETAAGSAAPRIVHDTIRQPGRPLDSRTREFFEPRFASDFSRVRVHTDANAVESARSVGALAYTVGQDIVFGTGQYNPHSAQGQRLLAHELTHVVQNSHSSALAPIRREESPAGAPSNAPAQTRPEGGKTTTTLASFWAYTPEPVKASVIDYAIDLAIEGVDSLQGRNFPHGIWDVFLRPGLLGFLRKLKSTGEKVKIAVIDKIARILAANDEAFNWAFLKGLLKGFFVDGALGIFIAIWDLAKGLESVWDFLKDLGQTYPQEIGSVLLNFGIRSRELVADIGPAIDELKAKFLDPKQSGSLSDQIVEKSRAFATRGGEVIAEKLLAFFSGPEASAQIGEVVGDLLGIALWEVVFAALTAGVGTLIKEGTGVIARFLRGVVEGILKVVSKVQEFFGKAVNAIKQAIGFVKGKLNELGGKFVELLESAEKFFARMLGACVEHSPVVCRFRPPAVPGLSPAYATFEEVEALIKTGQIRSKSHVLGVIIKDPEGKIVGQWFEASERGVGTEAARLLGHTEQKALARIEQLPLEPGSAIEFVGSLQSCNFRVGCSNVMTAFARRTGIPIRYRYVYGEAGMTINDFTAAEGRITKSVREGWKRH